ncbi:hypothetical protein SAMN05216298_1615 [Glycomyces sambucus]|uniref:Uncharacterized protein n=1 Tax=Glycomyces sambucus TaxID=380244 RepID=A0A1G9F705_9ACTN|nr:hypothetical protein [Glycomyces sambucus]SDK84125.1 hypothetical protein SAMN05216298_1615 [Glycomyces sambucus]
MPPLLTSARFPLRARWIVLLSAALLALAAVFWGDLRDAALGVAPASTDRTDWDAADLAAAPAAADPAALADGIDDLAVARTARLTAGAAVLDLVWEPGLAVTAVRVETYEDGLGSGVRLAVAADTLTEGGPHCLNARLTTGDGPALLQSCVRGDRHEPPGAAFLGEEEADRWRPDHLFITQTANLDPAGDAPREPLVDYFGLGSDTGNAYDSGLWGPNSWWPQHAPPPECATAPGLMLRLDDLHLTDRYADPDEHTRAAETVPAAAPAYPAEDRLLLPACIPVGADLLHDAVAILPFTDPGPVPFARWAQFNAASADPQPLRTAVAVDVRTCEADRIDRCSSSSAEDYPLVAADWMAELLDR